MMVFSNSLPSNQFKTVFKHLQKCSLLFFTMQGGGKIIKDFCKTIKKNCQFSFFVDILQLPHTVISNSEKLTHPTVHTFIPISLCETALAYSYSITVGVLIKMLVPLSPLSMCCDLIIISVFCQRWQKGFQNFSLTFITYNCTVTFT